MTEGDLRRIETRFEAAGGPRFIYVDVLQLTAEIRRLRSELASERATHQELWQLVDRELDRIYCDAKEDER